MKSIIEQIKDLNPNVDLFKSDGSVDTIALQNYQEKAAVSFRSNAI